ncbi:MAG: ribonuclease J [Oscillospiraceae bacterium]|nr:ribonuclease J [Oscillospiraceae bacterium]
MISTGNQKKGLLQPAKKIKIIPLGGMNEIGKNLTVFEYGSDIILLDCGVAFPNEEMFGIDLVIPDITYLQKHANRIKGIVLTHGHEDHVGSVPYVLKEFNVPVYGTKLTLGIVTNKLKEHKMLDKSKLHVKNPGESFRLGEFHFEFIRSNHSIADSVMVAITTPAGTIIHTGDFKIDCTPINGEMIDLARIGELGNQGVLALMADSTNAERPGYTMSESTVGAAFEKIFEGCEKRIVVATFASNIHRVQQIIDAAEKFNRKVAVTGRSMVNLLTTAMELGYMRVPKNILIDLDEIRNYPKERLVIVTTGSQGESMAALSRMASSDHKQVSIDHNDLIIFSSSPIPGNEKTISNVINELFKKGAEVIYESLEAVHVSGHACQEELKIILGLAKPKYFVPVHGEVRHIQKCKELGEKMGIDKKNIFVLENGKVLELSENEGKITGSVPSGYVLVDGLGVGDVGNIVLRDRKHLAQDGLIVVVVTMEKSSGEIISGPDIISRGFVYVRESEDLMGEIKQIVLDALESFDDRNSADWNSIKMQVKSALGNYLFAKTKRKPMILPVIMEV